MAFWQNTALSGKFERIIGLNEQALFKAFGKTKLKWKGLKGVLLHIEIIFKNESFRYIEDDIHTSILTAKLMILGQADFGLEVDPDNTEDCALKKPAKYIRSCKDRA